MSEDVLTVFVTLTWPDGSTEKLDPVEVQDRAEANRYIAALMEVSPGATFTFE